MKDRSLSKYFFFLTILFTSLVIAQPIRGSTRGIDPLINGLNIAIGWILSIFDTVLNVVSYILFSSSFDGELIYTKMLLFFIVLLVLYIFVVKKEIISDSDGVNWLILLCVSILSVRFLPDSLIKGITIPYGALAASIMVFLPLMLFFLIIHNIKSIGHFGRRFAWVIYGAFFIVLWTSESFPSGFDSGSNAGSIGFSTLGAFGPADVVYTVGLIFILISLLFDGAIHSYFGLGEYRGFKSAHRERLLAQLNLSLGERHKEYEKYATSGMASAANAVKKQIDDLEKRIKEVIKGF